MLNSLTFHFLTFQEQGAAFDFSPRVTALIEQVGKDLATLLLNYLGYYMKFCFLRLTHGYVDIEDMQQFHVE